MLVKILKMHSLDDAPWTWGSTWNSDMPDFFQGMPSGVYDNIYEDLDDSPVSWHITEVPLSLRLCPGCSDLLCGSRVAGDGGLHGLPMSQLADTSCVARSPSTPPITRKSTSAMSSASTKQHACFVKLRSLSLLVHGS